MSVVSANREVNMSSATAAPVTKSDFYTTTQAANCLGFSPDKVRSLCDGNKLEHDREGPNKNRRIKHESLVAMMKELGRPLGDLEPAVPAAGDVAADAGADPEQGNLPVRTPMATDEGHGQQS